MSKQVGIDIIDDNEFKIKWWDLNHEAQKRLLNTIFRTKPIAIAEFGYEEDIEEHNRVADYKDIVDLKTLKAYLERYDPKETFTVYQLIIMIDAAINRKKIQKHTKR